MPVTRFPARSSGPAPRLVDFLHHLRANGVGTSPKDSEMALQSLALIDATNISQARVALKSCLAHDPDQWRRFDELFASFWQSAGRVRTEQRQAPSQHVTSNAPSLWQAHFTGSSGGDSNEPPAESNDDPSGDAEGTDGRLIATRTNNLARRDLRELTDETVQKEAARIARKLAQAMRDRHSRRWRQARRGARLDLRRTMRSSLSRGGEIIDLKRQNRPERPRRIVAILDVSGSMTVYAKIFLAFLGGLISADTKADAYLFHTRLMRVTDALRDHDTMRAAARLSLLAEGFGGGTDIGGCLQQFAQNYKHTINGRTILIILSDGYCTGAPEKISGALSQLKQRAGRIIWLNPLLSWRDYAPITAGITAAQPHISAHLPANTLQALAALEPELAKL